MTKEQLKQEAEEYAEGMAKYYASTHEDCIPSQFEKYLCNAYISSAEPREKRITELEKELEEADNSTDCFNRQEELIAKATELLKRCYDDYIYLEPLRSEIEQFLHSEVEE